MTDNQTIELLPCPFCRGEAETHEVGFPYHYWDVWCDGECFDHFCEKPTEAEAIAVWNTRAKLGSESVDYMLNTIGKLEEENERLRSDNVELKQINVEYMDANHDQGMQLIEYHKRIAELESLVKTMYECGKYECNSCPHRKTEGCEFGSTGWLNKRMTALGLLDGDD